MNPIETDNLDAIELPLDLQAALHPVEAEKARRERLEQLSQLVCRYRQQAIEGRQQSGIEHIWLAAEEAYIGIDDVNRGHAGAPRWIKTPSMNGPILAQTFPKDRGNAEDVQATIFVRMTARYVDMAVAKLAEILLAPDEHSFSISATPVPTDLLSDHRQVRDPVTGLPLERDLKLREQPLPSGLPPVAAATSDSAFSAPAGQGPGRPLTVADLAEEAMTQAAARAKKMERRIHDQLVETSYNAQARKVLFDAARLGVGVLKGPFPMRRQDRQVRRTALSDSAALVEVHLADRLIPGVKWVSPWDFFPDPHCGESIHDGEFVFERDYVTEHVLADLKRIPGYLADQIDRVIREGPEKTLLMNDETERRRALARDTRYRIWYGQLRLRREDVLFLNPTLSEDELRGDEQVSVTVTIVNDCIIQVVPNLLVSGEFMYAVMPWQRREGSWAGCGLAELLDTPQRIVNGATRAMLTNAGDSAGVQLIIDRGCIEPADKDWRIRGRMIWEKKSDSIIDDVRKAFTIAQLPNATPQLMQLVEYGFRLAEEISNVPLISQGHSGKMPDTLGGLQLQDSNANQLLRYLASAYDDHVTARLIPRLYEWNMLDPTVPDDEKGDVVIHCQGSSALVDRHIHDQMLAQISSIVKDPAFGLNPRKWAKAWLRAKRMNIDEIAYSQDELMRIDAQPPPPPPPVQVAQLNAQVDLERMQREHDLRMRELEAKIQLETLRYANERQLTLEQIKAKLAEAAMGLRTQIHLASGPTAPAPQVATPPTEPPGRAEDGMAFQQ